MAVGRCPHCGRTILMAEVLMLTHKGFKGAVQGSRLWMEGAMRPALGEERMLLWGESLAGNSEEQGTGKHTIISKVPSFDVAPNRKPTWPARCTASLAGCFHAPGCSSEIRVYLIYRRSLCLTLRASSETRTSS